MGKIISILLVIIITLGALFYFGPDSMKFWEDQTANTIDSVTNNPNNSQHERINAKHQYRNGTHIVAGEVTLPTPCYVLTTSAMVAESFPEQVTIAFTSSTSGDVCVQLATTERFKIEFQASVQARIKATWNGQPVELNLIEASPNEDLTKFEIFIKG